jgi:hypothetical protein
LEAPNSANATAGKITVYSPVTIGVCAIVVYPITSGMATADRVSPATMSAMSHARR